MKRSHFFKSFLTLIAAPSILGKININDNCLFKKENIQKRIDEMNYQVGHDPFKDAPDWAKKAVVYEKGEVQQFYYRQRVISVYHSGIFEVNKP